MKGLRYEVLRHEVLRWRFRHDTKMLEGYDTVVFSGNCLGAVQNVGKNTKKIYYCHTPPRYIFDLREQYLSRIPVFLHPLAKWFLDRKAREYTSLLSHMDRIITNSKNVQKRLKDFTGYDSEIVYPPTDTSRFAPVKSEK